MSDYSEVLDLNLRIIRLIELYRDSGDKGILAEAFALLEPITATEAYATISRLGLRTYDEEDLVQEAWLKFVEVSSKFDSDRCPSFISFWRTSLRNHYIKYCKRELPNFDPTNDIIDNTSTYDIQLPQSMILDYVAELIAEHIKFPIWDYISIPYVNARAILLWKLAHRMLGLIKTNQATLAKEYGATQGYISTWEIWLRDKIASAFSMDEDYEVSRMIPTTNRVLTFRLTLKDTYDGAETFAALSKYINQDKDSGTQFCAYQQSGLLFDVLAVTKNQTRTYHLLCAVPWISHVETRRASEFGNYHLR